MRLLFVGSSTCRRETSYLEKSLDVITQEEMQIDRIPIEEYSKFDDSRYDYLMYNSFADEAHPKKFVKEVVYEADEKYYRFNRKKLLVDSHDDGNLDGFARFSDKKAPRIKLTPGYEFMKEYNVIITLPIRIRPFNIWKGEQKDILLMFGGNKKGFIHNIRKEVNERIQPFAPYQSKRIGMVKYAKLLKRTEVSVACPGWGPLGSAHNEILAAKAVLFSYESIKTVKPFPFAELVDGESYLSFNLNDLEDKLAWLLSSQEERERISENGRRILEEGYLPRKTAELILGYFKQ